MIGPHVNSCWRSSQNIHAKTQAGKQCNKKHHPISNLSKTSYIQQPSQRSQYGLMNMMWPTSQLLFWLPQARSVIMRAGFRVCQTCSLPATVNLPDRSSKNVCAHRAPQCTKRALQQHRRKATDDGWFLRPVDRGVLAMDGLCLLGWGSCWYYRQNVLFRRSQLT